MRIVLSAEDFTQGAAGPCGLLVQHCGGETYIVSWRNCAYDDKSGERTRDKPPGAQAKYGLTSLRDGMVLGWWTAAELLKLLHEHSTDGVYTYRVLPNVCRETQRVRTSVEKLLLDV